jgi:hypothetical protein
MTPTVSPNASVPPRAPSRTPGGAPMRSRRPMPKRAQDGMPAAGTGVETRGSTAARRKLDPLGHYTDKAGRTREVVAGRRGDGCVLVVDRDALTFGDRRLVAQLAADEPHGNAALVCAHYLRDASRGRCRRVSAEDLAGRPSADQAESQRLADGSLQGNELVGRRAQNGRHYAYRLEPMRTDTPVMELRWQRYPRQGDLATSTPVCLREVIGAVESYEPICGLTLRALAMYRENPRVSGAVLRSELERVRESPIVLNRKLRQAMFAAIERHGLSMSEIAHRCGRVKRDRKGNASGETSWLARRVGVLPESGTTRTSPWVHSDVLALIARNGLGISPREVELG